MDEKGSVSEVEVTGEQPLTVFIDKHKIVTLITPSATIGNCLRWVIFSTRDSSKI